METCISTDSLTGTNSLSHDQQADFMSPGIEEWKSKTCHFIQESLLPFDMLTVKTPGDMPRVCFCNTSVKKRSFKPLIRYYIQKHFYANYHAFTCLHKKAKTKAYNIKFYQYFTTFLKLIKCN